MTRDIPLDTPGEILAEEWLAPMGITQYALAKAIEVPARRINEIVQGKRAITADTAIRPGAFFWRRSTKLDEPPDALRYRTGA
jgi:antitoxin HigA-1